MITRGAFHLPKSFSPKEGLERHLKGYVGVGRGGEGWWLCLGLLACVACGIVGTEGK